eukprot:5151244-Prymnesium_polylepis.1
MCAAQNGHLACTQLLIEAKVDLDVQTAWGMTAWMTACKNGHRQVAQALREAGADCSKTTALSMISDMARSLTTTQVSVFFGAIWLVFVLCLFASIRQSILERDERDGSI